MVDPRKQWQGKPAEVQNTWDKFGLASKKTPKKKGETMTKRICSISSQVQNQSIITGMNANGPMVESKKRDMQLTTNTPTHTSSRITGEKNATTKKTNQKNHILKIEINSSTNASREAVREQRCSRPAQSQSIRIIMTAVSPHPTSICMCVNKRRERNSNSTM